MLDNEFEYVQQLEQRVLLLESLLQSFWDGEAPKGGSLEHYTLAKWGMRRLDWLAHTPAVLHTNTD